MQNKTMIALLIGLFAAAVLGGAAIILQPLPLGPPVQPTAAADQADQREVQAQIEAYKSLLAEDPSNPKYHQGLGDLYWSLGEWEEAAEHFGQALELSPEDDELRMMTAMARWHAGQTEQAVQLLRVAIQRNPDDALAQFYLGMLLANMEGQEAEAIAALERALTLAGEGELADQARRMLTELRSQSGIAPSPSPEAPAAEIDLFPRSLGGLTLEEAYGGERAKREIERLHGGKVRVNRGYVAYYADEERSATFWVSEAASEEEAVKLVDQMRASIAKGGTPFSSPEQITVPGLEAIPVYATQGMNQFHYIWVKRRLIVWVALDEPDPEKRLEFLKAAIVFIG
jgi:tetratricopeptide (TPR) repeat protein